MENGQLENGTLESAGEDDSLHALFRHADARQRPPQDTERDIRTQLHEHWQQRVRTGRKRKAVMAFGLAASITTALVITQQLLGPTAEPTTAEPVGLMVKHTGQVVIRPPGSEIHAPEGHAPGSLFAGHELETGRASLVALRWAGGESIRIGGESRVQLAGALEIQLLAGSIYIDSGRLPPATTGAADEVLVINTKAGRIRHIGTQYMARMRGDQVEVSVREGRVAILAEARQAVASMGEQLTLAPGAEATKRTVQTWGDLWAWTENAAPAIDLDGRTVLEFLQHVARESGHELTFSDAQTENLARRSMLSGSIDLPPMEALDVVLQTTDLDASTDGGRILIHSR